jgi:hypothetical protein
MTQNPDLTALPGLRLHTATMPTNPTQMCPRHLLVQASRRRQEQLLSEHPQKGQISFARSGNIDDAIRLAFSAIVNSADYAQAANIFLWNDIMPR